MKYLRTAIFVLFLQLLIIPIENIAQSPEQSDRFLQEMVDSVNHLLKTCRDGSVQPVLSVSINGDASLLDKKQSGFRFNLFQLKKEAKEDNDAGIEFVPENIGSITTNKWIRFRTEKTVVANIKFTATDEAMVKKIHGILLRIRLYVLNKAHS